MSCLACASNNHVELSATIVLNSATLQNEESACVELFPKLLVCLIAALPVLTSQHPNWRRLPVVLRQRNGSRGRRIHKPYSSAVHHQLRTLF